MALASIQHWLALIMALAFAGGAIANLVGPKPLSDGYRRWGYPPGFRIFAGVLNAIAAGLLFWTPGRPFGALLGLTITFASIATLGAHGEWRKTPASFVFLILLTPLLL